MKYPTEKDIQLKIGERILELREKNNISQSELCYAIEIDISTLSRLERGKLNVTLRTLYKIAKHFGIEVKDLL